MIISYVLVDLCAVNINKDNSYNNKNQENDNNHYIGFGVGIAILLGIVIGAVMDYNKINTKLI